MLYVRTMKKGNTRANLSINEQVWRHFRAICLQEGTDASSVIEQFMRRRIAEQKEHSIQYTQEEQQVAT
jgi:hypothetical protein